VTADKDLMQLVSPHVKIYSLRRVDNQQEIPILSACSRNSACRRSASSMSWP
jgi:5'-3' exonuclease